MTPRLITRLAPVRLPSAVRARVGRRMLRLELGVLCLGLGEQRVERLLADWRKLVVRTNLLSSPSANSLSLFSTASMPGGFCPFWPCWLP